MITLKTCFSPTREHEDLAIVEPLGALLKERGKCFLSKAVGLKCAHYIPRGVLVVMCDWSGGYNYLWF